MIWIDDIQFAKSIADLKMSDTVTAAKLHPNFEVLDSQVKSCLKKTSREECLLEKMLHKQENAFSREGTSHG